MKQDVAHLHVFGVTTYIYIFPDLHLSKLGPRATHLVFIRHFGVRNYKLLDQETESMYSGQNIHFEKGTANLIVELQYVE